MISFRDFDVTVQHDGLPPMATGILVKADGMQGTRDSMVCAGLLSDVAGSIGEA